MSPIDVLTAFVARKHVSKTLTDSQARAFVQREQQGRRIERSRKYAARTTPSRYARDELFRSANRPSRS